MPALEIDFAAVKSAVSIEQVLRMCDTPKLTRHGEQYRAPCPRCKSGGDRALVVTPSKAAFYCFAEKRGGDSIALLAHIHGISQREAAQAIQNHFGLEKSVAKADTRTHTDHSPEPTNSSGGRGVASSLFKVIDALLYLDPAHEALEPLGISPETIEHFGGGYASKGVMRGRLALPIHTHDGKLIAYVGLSLSDDIQPRLHFHNFENDRYLFNLNRVTSDDVVYVARDPLDVLRAYQEGGVTNVASFLSPMTANALLVLSSVMDDMAIESVEVL